MPEEDVDPTSVGVKLADKLIVRVNDLLLAFTREFKDDIEDMIVTSGGEVAFTHRLRTAGGPVLDSMIVANAMLSAVENAYLHPELYR